MIHTDSPGRRSARWKVFQNKMKGSVLHYASMFLLCCLVFMTACKEKTATETAMKSEIKTDSLTKPKVDIKVNRHYDDQGNMIGFDSTYSSYYSSIKGDTQRMDSVFRDFDSYFRKQHQAVFNNRFNDVFFNDSLGYPDFFHNDFFTQRYMLNDKYFRDMMSQMDSLKNKHYKHSPEKKKS